jgi:hypothetical protein
MLIPVLCSAYTINYAKKIFSSPMTINTTITFINFGTNKYDIYQCSSPGGVTYMSYFLSTSLTTKSVVPPASASSKYVNPQKWSEAVHLVYDALLSAKASYSARCAPESNAVCGIIDVFSHNDISLKKFSYPMKHTISHCLFSWFIKSFCSLMAHRYYTPIFLFVFYRLLYIL